MSHNSISSSIIKKIGHPIQEIRERNLIGLLSKLKYGYNFDNELARSKELLLYLLQWFQYDSYNYQDIVLIAILDLLKSQCGKTLIDYVGSQSLITKLNKLKSKLKLEYHEILNKIINFLANSNMTSTPRLDIPALNISSSSISATDGKDMYVHVDDNVEDIHKIDKKYYESSLISSTNKVPFSNISMQDISIFFLPWCHLNESDLQKIIFNEECMQTTDSEERAIYFFSNILLKDFPAEVFLNRPTTISILQKLIKYSKEYCLPAMEALTLYCFSISARIKQLQDSNLKNGNKNSYNRNNIQSIDCLQKNNDTHQIHNDNKNLIIIEDSISTLKQISLPHFCLDTMYLILNLIGQNISHDKLEDNNVSLSLKELNIAITLQMNLLNILKKIVKKSLWHTQSNNRFTLEIIQKSVTLFRLCGDVLNKSRISCLLSENMEAISRVSYLRLLNFSIALASWCDYSPIIPQIFTSTLYKSIEDVSFFLTYPNLYKKLSDLLQLQNFDSLTSEERNKYKLYLNAKHIAISMNSAIKLLQNYNSLLNSTNIINIINESINSLEFHKNLSSLEFILNILSVEILKWNLDDNQWKDVKNITSQLLAHNSRWVQEKFYIAIHSLVVNVLGGLIRTNDDISKQNELSLNFLLDSSIIMEICSYGLESDIDMVSTCAKDIIQHLIRGKLLVSENTWSLLLGALLPSLPLLHSHAAHDDPFGKSIIKTLDMKIGECMLIPQIELIKGNLRMLYSKCFTAQMEGSKTLIKLLNTSEGANTMLPNNECIHPDLLCTTIRSAVVRNFNITKPDQNFYEEGALLQVINLLKIKSPYSKVDNSQGKPSVDPTFCRSALSQLAVMLQQTNLHKLFLENSGCELIVEYLSKSLTAEDYTTFPESAVSCISIINSLCYNSSTMRQWASEQISLLLNIIRGILLFPNDANFISTVTQLLALLLYSHFITNLHATEEDDSKISLHFSIVQRMNLPFKCRSHAKQSIHRKENNEEWMMKQPLISSYLRIHWCVMWYGGLENVIRWPYIPDSLEKLEFNQNLMINDNDLSLIKITSPIQGCISSLYSIQNATSHKSVDKFLDLLTSYILLIKESDQSEIDLSSLPWHNTLRRYIVTPPASPKDSLLLLNFIKFLRIFMLTIRNDNSIMSWIIDAIHETSRGITKLLKGLDDDLYLSTDLMPFKLREQICLLLSDCKNMQAASTNLDNNSKLIDDNWNNIINHLSESLSKLQIKNINCLAYANQIINCLTDITASSSHKLTDGSSVESHIDLVKYLVYLCDSLYSKKDYCQFKGLSLLSNSMIALCHLLNIFLLDDKHMKIHVKSWVGDCSGSAISICLAQRNSYHIVLRIASLKLLSGLMSSENAIIYIENDNKFSIKEIANIGINVLSDVTEASFVREQAANILCNLLATKMNLNSKYSKYCENPEIPLSLFEINFFTSIVTTLTKVCIDDENIFTGGDNISLEYLSNREHYEVAYSKHKINHIPIKVSKFTHPNCSLDLLIGIADVVYNILLYYGEIPQCMMTSEIFKILFRCITLKVPILTDKIKMCTSICRTLYKATDLSNEIHVVLIDTMDCISGLLGLYTLDIESVNSNISHKIKMWKWLFLLTGTLIQTSHGYKCLWNILSEIGLKSFFNCILITFNDNSYSDIQSSALFCLVNVLNSYTLYDRDVNDINLEQFLDQIVPTAPQFFNDDEIDKKITSNTEKKSSYGPFLAHFLIKHYKMYNRNITRKRISDTNFDSIASGLCNLFAISHKAKIVAVENKFVEEIIENLIEIQYILLTDTDQLNIIKNKKKSPIIHYFNWTVLILCNVMSNCDAAKEICIDKNLVAPINKMWPWILSDNMLRFHTIQMLCSYTNSNPKASQTMCLSIGTRSLLLEILDLTIKEMNLVTRKHALTTLRGCLQILENVCSHVHCRTVIIKSDLLGCLNKLHPAITKRQTQWKQVEIMWEQFGETLSKYSEGQIKIAEYIGILCALIHQADGVMLSVLRNCAFSPINRPRFLGSAEVIQLFSNVLKMEYALSDKMCVFVALWALCANNHKSKLSIKTSGLAGKMADCLQHTKHLSSDNEREIQIMTYVLKVISL